MFSAMKSPRPRHRPDLSPTALALWAMLGGTVGLWGAGCVGELPEGAPAAFDYEGADGFIIKDSAVDPLPILWEDAAGLPVDAGRWPSSDGAPPRREDGGHTPLDAEPEEGDAIPLDGGDPTHADAAPRHEDAEPADAAAPIDDPCEAYRDDCACAQAAIRACGGELLSVCPSVETQNDLQDALLALENGCSLIAGDVVQLWRQNSQDCRGLFEQLREANAPFKGLCAPEFFPRSCVEGSVGIADSQSCLFVPQYRSHWGTDWVRGSYENGKRSCANTKASIEGMSAWGVEINTPTLASLDTYAARKAARTLLSQERFQSEPTFWVGLSRLEDQAGRWAWANGRVVAETDAFWRPRGSGDQSRAYCGAAQKETLLRGGAPYLSRELCNGNRPILCEYTYTHR